MGLFKKANKETVATPVQSSANELVIKNKKQTLTMKEGAFEIRTKFGSCVLPFDQIAAILIKMPGALAGRIIFQRNIAPSTSYKVNKNTTINQGTDIHVPFDKEQEAVAIEMRTRFEQYQKNGAQVIATPAKSAADEIKKYKELLDIGAITQEEYDLKKSELLGL